MNLTLDLKVMTEQDHFQAFSSSLYFGFVIPSNCLIYKSKAKFSGSYAPVKVNRHSPPPPRICGALVGLYRHIVSSWSTQYVGDLRVEECGALVGDSF